MMIEKKILEVTQSLRVLYVEDDVDARFTTLEFLNHFFNEVVVAVNGRDGLEKFQEKHFDLVLSDINMPKMNGIDMVEKIRELDSDVFILFLSAYNETKYLSKGIDLSIDAYMLKPLRLPKFLVVLKKIANRVVLQRNQSHYQNDLELEVEKKTQEISRQLHFDELTSLHSRYSFFKDVENIQIPIIFIVDINQFKSINEIYGFKVGSLVLQQFADFLLNFTKDTSYKVYRISGDEFLVLDTSQSIDTDAYERDIKKFFKQMDSFSVKTDADMISIEVSVGISIAQADAFECAKIALDYAKENQQTYKMYSQEIDSRIDAQKAMLWKERTKAAINDNRIVPVFQPIVDKNENILKYETLMRLRDENTKELISPHDFLDIAIKTGLYRSLSNHVIFEALYLLENSTHTLSLNFSYTDIKNITFLNELETFFKLSPELGKRVVFEITESENITDYVIVKKFIKRFKAYSIKIAIDDFGSGFSNFEYILEIEPDYLKIDGSLIKNIDTDAKAHILVKAIVQFAHELDIKIIAEYVHSQKIFEMLKVLDVDEYQGFYFSQALEHI